MNNSKYRYVYFILGILSLIIVELLMRSAYPSMKRGDGVRDMKLVKLGTSIAQQTWLVSGLSSSQTTPNVPYPTSSWRGRLLAQVAMDLLGEDVTADEITRYLIVKWLEDKMAVDVREKERIIAYEIHQIRYDQSPLHVENFISSHPENFVTIAYVEYSVKPAQLMYSDWVAGGGEVDFKTGWVRHKGDFIAIVVGNKEYIAYFIGGL